MSSFLCFLFLCALTFVNGELKRIIGGSFASIGEFPFIVSIRQRNNHFCGGTIITSQHILTAAHCLDGRIVPPYSSITVVSGTNSLSKGGQTHRIIDAIYHPQYYKNSDMSIPNDIAILKLAAPMQFNNYQNFISLASRPPQQKSDGVVVGWGNHISGAYSNSETLKKYQTQIIIAENCSPYLKTKLNHDQFCGIQSPGLGVCWGDSGGPFVVNKEVMGLVSWGSKQCASGSPDVYTNVFRYKNFILQNIKLY